MGKLTTEYVSVNLNQDDRRELEAVLSKPFSSARTDTVAPHYYNALSQWAQAHSQVSGELGRALNNSALPRLAGLREVGILTNPADLVSRGRKRSGQRVSHHPSFQVFDQRRLTHSFLVGWRMLSAAVQSGYSVEVQAKAAAAGVGHDEGHAGLSHVGDQLADDLTQTTHESRSIRRLREPYSDLVGREIMAPDVGWGVVKFPGRVRSRQVDEFLVEQGDIILEKPGLGQFLKLIDTLSYLQLDLAEAGIDLKLTSLVPLLGKSISLNTENGALVVDEKGRKAILELLNVRRQAYALLYNHPDSLIAEEMHMKGIKRVIELGVLRIEDLLDGVDDQIYGALLAASLEDPISANLLAGFHQGITAFGSGQYEVIDSIPVEQGKDLQRDDIEARVLAKTDLRPHEFVVVRPPNPGGKRVRVSDSETGQEDILKATSAEIYHPLQGQILVCVHPDGAGEFNKHGKRSHILGSL